MTIEALQRTFRHRLLVIGAVHSLVTVCVLVGIVWLNVDRRDTLGEFDFQVVLVNAAMLSLLGGFLYFSRKAYVYLITDKFTRFAKDDLATQGSSVESRVQARVAGYTLYLWSRPFCSVVVGPLLLLAIMAGLTTLVEKSAAASLGLSTSGVYLVYFVSFIGGYSSSDLFDYFSTLGGRLVKRISLDR
jgi:hypothetical protein